MTETGAGTVTDLATRAIVGDSRHLARLASVTASPSRQARIASAYAALPEWSPAAVPAFLAFALETGEQWQTLRTFGFRMVVQDVDPYASAGDMMAEVVSERVIRVLATAVTGGHPFLTDEQNDTFRAVHDVLGHTAAGRGFDRHGEEAAYRAHARCYSSLAVGALATETRGQNAVLIGSGTFPVQKVATLPTWARTLHALDPIAGERPATLAQAATFHAAAGLES